MFDYDAELRRYHPRLLEAADVDADARVLDIGCGTGQLTRAAARAATRGDALGIDISAPTLTRARELTRQHGPANVRFEHGDAQVHPLPAAWFSLAVSRFGTMFFADPGAAFANIAAALRPGARFVQLVWQHRSQQEWNALIRRALIGAGREAPSAGAEAAFSLAEPAVVQTLLTQAGFADVQLADVREPVCYGPDGAGALQAIRSLRVTDDLLRDLDDASARRALGRLRRVLDARQDGGVWFDSAAWLVTAYRR